MSDRSSPVVLVHGAWHGPWCWERVTPLLDQAGVEWQALDLPTMDINAGHITDIHCDASKLRDILDGLERPAVIVGHSYGGLVITEGAADHALARHLVYLAAFMPDAGEHMGTLLALDPNPELEGAVEVSTDRRLTLAPGFVGPGLYGDCDDATLAWASARLRPMLSETTEAVRAAAWRTIPSTYVVCAQDRVILPSLQRTMAKRATRVVEWETSHSPFASQPHLVGELIVALSNQP